MSEPLPFNNQNTDKTAPTKGISPLASAVLLIEHGILVRGELTFVDKNVNPPRVIHLKAGDKIPTINE